MLQSKRRPRNVTVMLHVALFKGSSRAVVDAVIVTLVHECVLLLAETARDLYFTENVSQ